MKPMLSLGMCCIVLALCGCTTTGTQSRKPIRKSGIDWAKIEREQGSQKVMKPGVPFRVFLSPDPVASGASSWLVVKLEQDAPAEGEWVYLRYPFPVTNHLRLLDPDPLRAWVPGGTRYSDEVELKTTGSGAGTVEIDVIGDLGQTKERLDISP